MTKLKRLLDRSISYFCFGVMILIWVGLAVWMVCDWRGFWLMVWGMEWKTRCITLFILFIGPFWLIAKRRKPSDPQKQEEVHADVVYLRPFTVDASAFYELGQSALAGQDQSLEQLLVHELKVLGSVVAIGRPDDHLVRDGADRIYVGFGGDWKSCVQRLTRSARAVVLVAGKSPGLLWEKEHARKNVPPHKLLVVFPPTSRNSRERMFRNLDIAFDMPFPRFNERMRVPRFVMFDETWNVIVLPNVYKSRMFHLFGFTLKSTGDYLDLGRTLLPFLSRLNASKPA